MQTFIINYIIKSNCCRIHDYPVFVKINNIYLKTKPIYLHLQLKKDETITLRKL